jgi:cell division initiation protein
MKITPLEIRQKSFEKKLRGYDKDEVNAFLFTLSQIWEQVMEENKELSLNFENAQREIKQLREVENSLFKTLKTAEDTGANMIDQANKAAELHLRETQMSADALLNEAKSKARTTIEEADDKASQIITDMESEVKSIAKVYRSLENHRDNLLSELENLSNDTLRRIDKLSAQSKTFDLDEFLKNVKSQAGAAARKEGKPAKSVSSTKQMSETRNENPTAPEEVTDSSDESAINGEEETSFFDKLG